MRKKKTSKPLVPGPTGAPRLSRLQKALNRKLLDLDEKRDGDGQKVYGLSRIYLGAVYVMEDSENVDRFAHAAHGFRELMEKLARSVPQVGVPSQKAGAPSLKWLVQDLKATWERTKHNSKCHDDGKWEGCIDPPVEKFLGKLKDFFHQVANFRPPREQQGANLLKNTDFLYSPLPAQIEQLRIKEWKNYNDYFEEVAHHGSVESYDIFVSWVIRFEEFLHGRLIPQTTRSKQKLLAIIKEGQDHA